MNILQLSPAGCDNRVNSHIVYAEEKIDGHRGLFHFGEGLDRGYLTGRRISKKTKLLTEKGLNVPHLMAAGERLATEGFNYTVLDGEVVVPGYPFEAVQSVMGSGPERAQAWQEENALAKYVVFDILFYDGKDMRNRQRKERRLFGMDVAGDLGELCDGAIEFVSWKRTFCSSERDAFFQKVVDRGGEGLVIKSLTGKYGVGQKKMKKVKTFDVVITGFTDARKGKTGKYLGLIGAVKFSAYRNGRLVEVGQCSGMNDDQRILFSKKKEWYLGKVVEVKSNGVTKHGRLRHPQFLRLRSDKAPEECVAP